MNKTRSVLIATSSVLLLATPTIATAKTGDSDTVDTESFHEQVTPPTPRLTRATMRA